MTEGIIVSSVCSCLFGATNGGKCKHVIAMLLVLMKKQQVTPTLATAETQVEIGTLTRNRSLPKWASETAPTVLEY